MTTFEKIKYHCENKIYAKIIRQVAEKHIESSNGYIIGFSEHFILLQGSNDFMLGSFLILPIAQIKKVRFNENDKFYNKVMIKEGEADKVGIDHEIDLTSWQTIFTSIKKHYQIIIVECEDPDIDTFTIGPLIKATKKSVFVRYFTPTGILEEKPTPINYHIITRVEFNGRYGNIFSKYLKYSKK